MNISEIRIKLMEESSDRLRAFCSVTIDNCFVIRDLKIIDGSSGPFVAMPSRKLTGHCVRCHHKNHLRSNYCNHCGSKQPSVPATANPQKLYADVAHPINSDCRQLIQDAVIHEFEAELQRAGEPGYRSRYDDGFDDAGTDAIFDSNNDEDFDDDSAATRGGPDDRTVEFDRPQSTVRKPAADKPRKPTESARDDDQTNFGEGIF